jgi:hypothetical protein
MQCPIAAALFQKYSTATIKHFEATDKLVTLTGQHGEFGEAEKATRELYADCRKARLAMEHHWAEHGCRFSGQ